MILEILVELIDIVIADDRAVHAWRGAQEPHFFMGILDQFGWL